MFLNYVNDNTHHRINKTIEKYGLKIRLVSKPAPQLSSVLNNKSGTRLPHKDDCHLCKLISRPNNNSCQTRYVVYQFICKLCGKSYIGQTARPFHFRYKEHSRSITNRNEMSALGEHVIKVHTGNRLTIRYFNIKFLEIFDNPVDCKINEAKQISIRNPELNRRNELTQW